MAPVWNFTWLLLLRPAGTIECEPGSHSTYLTARYARGWLIRWWTPDVVGEGLEVLHDGGEMEFVACAAETPKTLALETVVSLEVGKALYP